ncbi:hypothetical protein [Polluticoccus soli]|uniref:hypothetical protein n=1 Tax=Polluticoccus soli TaxID=3034150 RepID=UPI0023E230C5|nr:hypothetical protein [Flavipsychrobacter sp. JY13-12]
METKKFSPKDAKLIRDNPHSAPEELSTLGLSKAAYNRLTENTVTSIQNLQPVKVEAAPQQPQPGRRPNHVVRMLNKATNVVTELGYRAALSVSSTYPDKFEILSK